MMRFYVVLAVGVLGSMASAANDKSTSDASATLMNCLKTGLPYPAASLRHSEEGKLLIQFNVDGQGQIHQEIIQTPTAFPALNTAALQHFQHCAQHKTDLPEGSYVVPIVFQIEN